MKHHSFILYVYTITAFCIGGLLYVNVHTTPPKGVTISMLSVGQGDSFLIQTSDGKQLLIDGGKDASVLEELAKILPAGDTTIDVVVATHPDADHIGGLPLVLSRYSVGLFITSDVQGTSALYKKLFTTLYQKNIPAYFARKGMSFVLDATTGTQFTILFPDRSTKQWETNTASVIGMVQTGDTPLQKALFMGDAPISIEQMLVASIPHTLQASLLKLGHHGSKTASSESFLQTVHPSIALISAGVANTYGHPHNEVLNRLRSLGIPWVSTQDSGTVTFLQTPQGWQKVQ